MDYIMDIKRKDPARTEPRRATLPLVIDVMISSRHKKSTVRWVWIAKTALLLLAGASVAHASQTSGTIDPAYKYAWSTVAGYVNFAPTNGGLTITDSAITGYAWGANTGWLNFSATNGGVTNNAAGALGGYAWDEGAGWVSFTGVTIDSSGKFRGTATGGTVNGASYVLNFDCASCDVRTDWRPASSRTTGTSSSGGNGAISLIIITAATTTTSIQPVASPVSPPFQTVPGASGRNNSTIKPIVYPPSVSLKKSAASSTARAATTTTPAKKSVASSLFNFIRSIVRSIYSGTLAFFRFFVRF